MIYDYIVIGSGFGGSVSALRLAEKGYSVRVIEQGRRLNPSDFPKTNWNLAKYLRVPYVRFFGFQKLSFYTTASILSGTGSSGIGRYHGKRTFKTFFNLKSVIKKSTLFDIWLRYPPYSKF